jgi:hypothetical protein
VFEKNPAVLLKSREKHKSNKAPNKYKQEAIKCTASILFLAIIGEDSITTIFYLPAVFANN